MPLGAARYSHPGVPNDSAFVVRVLVWVAMQMKSWCQLRCVRNSALPLSVQWSVKILKLVWNQHFSHFPKVILDTGTQKLQTRRCKHTYIIHSLCDRRVKDHYSTLAKGILIAEVFKITLKGALIFY